MFHLIVFVIRTSAFISLFCPFLIFFLYSLSVSMLTRFVNVFVLLSNIVICPNIVCFLDLRLHSDLTISFLFLHICSFASFVYEVLMHRIAQVLIIMIIILLHTVAARPTPFYGYYTLL